MFEVCVVEDWTLIWQETNNITQFYLVAFLKSLEWRIPGAPLICSNAFLRRASPKIRGSSIPFAMCLYSKTCTWRSLHCKVERPGVNKLHVKNYVKMYI